MAYNVTGGAGNDTLNQSSDTGPGTVVGLAGDDTISTGSGLATVTGDSGNDSVLLRAGNTGTVSGGTENDSIFAPAGTGSMQLFGNAGGDTIVVDNAVTAAQTLVGGDDSSDGADTLWSGGGNDIVFGNGGNDNMLSGLGSDTQIGGFGNDSISKNLDPAGNDLVFGNQGNDTVWVSGGNDTVFSGLGNDCIYHDTAGRPVFFGNEGNDTVNATFATSATIVGGNDSADGGDSLTASGGADLIFGNGGNDSLFAAFGADTLVGGFGNDDMDMGGDADLAFGNEGNDTVASFSAGNTTVFGGLGNDSIRTTTAGGRDTLQGNEGNDTIRGNADIDTIAGGSGNDVFLYTGSDDDGDNATGGGPVEQITDLDWSVDRFETAVQVTFASNTGAGTGATLNDSANNAIASAFALGGGGGTIAAAQFTFAGRTYLAIDQAGAGTFADAVDLLLDITGVTGTIATSQFI